MHAVHGERGAQARTSLHEGILLIELEGISTAATLADIAARSVAAYGDACSGFIIDFRRTLLVATADQLDQMVQRHPRGTAIYYPGAFVSNEEQEPVLLAHAINMARCRMYRKTFDDTLSAHDWVKLRARSYRAAALRDASASR